LDRIRSLTNLIQDLDVELKHAKAKVKQYQAEIRKTEAERDELITSTEFQTVIPGCE
jgi:hypothetical protein